MKTIKGYMDKIDMDLLKKELTQKKRELHTVGFTPEENEDSKYQVKIKIKRYKNRMMRSE